MSHTEAPAAPQPESAPPAAPPSSAPKSPLGLLAFVLMLTIIGAIGLVLAVWTTSRTQLDIGIKRRQPLRVYTQVPPFELIERSGQTVSLDSLRGGIWIADFIFTRCGGTCPTMSRSMKSVQASISHNPHLWPAPRLVSITVDPEWDTPERLARYAERFEADSEGWLFLTGKYAEIQQLAREGFLVGVQEGHDDPLEPIIHSQSLILVDHRGRVRGYYDGTDPAAVRLLLADVMRLNREVLAETS
jgi:cytochrome oxidase Cu insertion factor (SCO1/SenC/PrrC family)